MPVRRRGRLNHAFEVSNFPSLAICAVELFCLNFAALVLGPSRRWLERLGRHDYVLADRSEIPLQPNGSAGFHPEGFS